MDLVPYDIMCLTYTSCGARYYTHTICRTCRTNRSVIHAVLLMRVEKYYQYLRLNQIYTVFQKKYWTPNYYWHNFIKICRIWRIFGRHTFCSIAHRLPVKSEMQWQPSVWFPWQQYISRWQQNVINKTGLSKEDQILITNLYLFKGYGTKRLMKELPTKFWKKTTLNNFLKRLRCTDRKSGSGQPRTVRTDENIDAVNELVLSQEDALQSHHIVWQISRKTGIHHSSVTRIIWQDLRITTANCTTRLNRAK